MEARLSGRQLPSEADVTSGLKQEKGVFVTLLDNSKGNRLRGCIGIPYPTRSILEQVRIAAEEVATSDPRFEQLSLDELKNRIIVEVTVLADMEPIWVKNPLDLRENIVVGRDGLMVESKALDSHGLLLPQVAVDEGFDSEEFLSHCCLKADLPPDAWLAGNVRVSRFQGQIFVEERPNGPVVERLLRPKR